MKNKKRVSMGRIVGKVDNDFNLSESDWIPRAAAWIIDALSQMKCLPTELKTRKVEVSGRIAIFPCQLDTSELKIYDRNGCEIKEAGVNIPCCGNVNSASSVVKEIAVIDDSRNFVITNNGHIELNFDTDWINVQSFEPMTYHDDYYDCEVPMVYDNGILLEAISFYILYKYLSRGSHHPVYDLKSSSPVTNPYIQWKELKSKAIASVRNDLYNADGWRNFFYNSTFDPRR